VSKKGRGVNESPFISDFELAFKVKGKSLAMVRLEFVLMSERSSSRV